MKKNMSIASALLWAIILVISVINGASIFMRIFSAFCAIAFLLLYAHFLIKKN